MIIVSPKHKIFVAIQPLDFRKGAMAIASVCKQQFQLDPMSGHYFIFHNRRSTDIKILYYDNSGFCLWQKRLSKGRFSAWPTLDKPLVTLTPAQLHVLINNGDPTGAATPTPWSELD